MLRQVVLYMKLPLGSKFLQAFLNHQFHQEAASSQ